MELTVPRPNPTAVVTVGVIAGLAGAASQARPDRRDEPPRVGKIGFSRSVDTLLHRRGYHYAAVGPSAMVCWWEQVGAVCGDPKRGLGRSRTLSLSCANAIEVQVDLDGGIQLKTAPRTGSC
jgi:hypothetical protein